jgi:septal ring factor EnvC (AmiA/AmiB activator)
MQGAPRRRRRSQPGSWPRCQHVGFVVAAIGLGAVIAIVAGTIALLSVLGAIVKVQGDRITDARTDLNRQIETVTGRIEQLDKDVARRVDELSKLLDEKFGRLEDTIATSFEQSATDVGGKLDGLNSRIDDLIHRVDRVEERTSP